MNEKALVAGDAIEHQRREWTVQRVAWVIMGLVVVAALLGVLGSDGPLASATARAPDGSLEVAHTRFDHHNGVSAMTLTVSPGMVKDGEVRIWLDSRYAQGLDLQGVLPEAESVEVGPDRYTYVFAVSDTSGPLEIVFNYQHEGYWRQQGRIGVEGGGEVKLTQFVYP